MICPVCNVTDMVKIWYGFPGEEQIMLAQFDQIVLGGPVVKEYTHFCNLCQTTYPISE